MAMTSPAIGTKDLLVAAGAGVFASTSGWNISVGKFPTSPDTSIVCVETGGLSPYPHLLLNFPSIQVMVRGAANGYVAASDKIRAVVDALLGAPAQAVNGDDWQGIRQLGDVAFIGYDESNRPLFTSNFSIIVEPKAGGYRQALA